MTELIIKSGVRDTLDNHPISSDFYEALDEEVEKLVEDASGRAEANDRQTVMPKDL